MSKDFEDMKEKQDKTDALMVYFMGQTNERLGAIELKLVELISFRAEVLAQAKADSKTTALIYSVISAIIVLLITVGLKKFGVS